MEMGTALVVVHGLLPQNQHPRNQRVVDVDEANQF